MFRVQARQRPRGARPRGRQDAALPHPHPPGRPRPGGGLAVRPQPGADRLPPSVSSASSRRRCAAMRWSRSAAPARPGVVRWLGDDAAVVRARRHAVDLDRRDGRRHALPARPGVTSEDAGWRALAGALSDLAAMGAEPGEAYLVGRAARRAPTSVARRCRGAGGARRATAA